MPLLSVQRYIQGVFDGLPVPGQAKALVAKITPPVSQNLDGPVAFVWGGSMRAERQAGPRGKPGGPATTAGFKHLQWDVDVWLCYLTNPKSPTLDSQFPAFVDAVMSVMYQPFLPALSSGTSIGPADESINVMIASSSLSASIWKVDRSNVQLRTPFSALDSAVVSAFTSEALGWNGFVGPDVVLYMPSVSPRIGVCPEAVRSACHPVTMFCPH